MYFPDSTDAKAVPEICVKKKKKEKTAMGLKYMLRAMNVPKCFPKS